MTKLILIATAILLAAAGCASNDARDYAECVGYGFEPATEGYANCRLMISQRRATIAAGILAR